MTEDSELDRQLDLVRRNADSGRNFTQWRDLAIRRARHCGATYRQIADMAGLTPAGIGKIIKKKVDNLVNKSTIDT